MKTFILLASVISFLHSEPLDDKSVKEASDPTISASEEKVIIAASVAVKNVIDEGWIYGYFAIYPKKKQMIDGIEKELNILEEAAEREVSGTDKPYFHKMEDGCDKEGSASVNGKSSGTTYVRDLKSVERTSINRTNEDEKVWRERKGSYGFYDIHSSPTLKFESCNYRDQGVINGVLNAVTDIKWETTQYPGEEIIFYGDLAVKGLSGELKVSVDGKNYTLALQNISGSFHSNHHFGKDWDEISNYLTRMISCNGSALLAEENGNSKIIPCDEFLHFALPKADYDLNKKLASKKK